MIFILMVLFFYCGLHLMGGMFRLSWRLFRGIFSVGLFFVFPVLLIVSLVFSLLANAWPILLIIFVLCMAGRKNTENTR